MLAIKWAVKKFKCYIYGVEFEVHTDHKPIIHIKTSKKPSERMLKWILELEEYNIQYFYRPGKFNVPADILSRLDEKAEDEQMNWYQRSKSLVQLKEEQWKTHVNTQRMLEASDDETYETVVAISGMVQEEVGKMDLIRAQKTDKET